MAISRSAGQPAASLASSFSVENDCRLSALVGPSGGVQSPLTFHALATQVFHWNPHDVFVVPSWVPCTHRAAGDAVLFSYSDRAVQDKLDLFREQRL